MTGDLTVLHNISDFPSSVTFPNGQLSNATKRGTLKLSNDYSVNDVLFVPDFNCTLISVSKLLKQTGCIAIFTDTLCVLHDRFSRTLIGAGEEREGVYYFTGVKVARVHGAEKSTSSSVLRHRRLGHPSYKVLATLPVFDTLKIDFSASSHCDICFKAKQTRSAFPDSLNKAEVPFGLIHCDVWGPYRTPASCGAVYFLTVVDDYSRAVWTYLMLEKSEVSTLLKNFCTMSEKQFGRSVKMIRTDNGTEFMVLKSFFRNKGSYIIHHTSCVDTSQQNGRVERKHMHILNVARACLFQARLPVDFWGENILVAAHIINRTPTPVLNGKTPYELLHGKPPVYDLLRVFGSLCYAQWRPRSKDKFAERSRKCIFVGYLFGKKAWRMYDIETHKFFISRDVTFFEDQFPGVENTSYVSPPSLQQNEPIDDWLAPALTSRGSTDIPPQNTQSPVSPDTVAQPEQQPPTTSVLAPTDVTPIASTDITPPTEQSDSPSTPSPMPESPPSHDLPTTSHSPAAETSNSPGLLEVLGRGNRIKKPSILLKNFITHAASTTNPSHVSHVSSPDQSSSSTVSGKTPYPIANYLSVFNDKHQAFLAKITTDYIPRNYKEAVVDPRFNGAMQAEILALEANHTWEVTSLPPGKKEISNKWIYTIKYKADGAEERPKARLVACGNRQKEGTYYKDTFAPVVKMNTVRFFLKIAATKRWEIHQMDVHNAFLHGDLEEEIYMQLPQGFKCSDLSKVCRLRKSLYGLKQSPRCWFAKLSKTLFRFCPEL